MPAHSAANGLSTSNSPPVNIGPPSTDISPAIYPSSQQAKVESNPSGMIQLGNMTLEEIERCAIEATLDACNGNKAKTARTLGISEKSVYNKMRRLGITWPKKQA